MLHEQKNKNHMVQNERWQPSATLSVLKKRAAVFAKIRQFFAERNVLEVDTPLISHATVTDPYINSIPVSYQAFGSCAEKLYLQTSPEYAMKRLLSSGSGSIYQIAKAFRQGELGRLHNPEFTMLEWYRLRFDHHQLMDEMDELLQHVMQTVAAERIPYGTLFKNYVGTNPHEVSVSELQEIAKNKGIIYTDAVMCHTNSSPHLASNQSSSDLLQMDVAAKNTEKNKWLDLLFTHCIEPHLGSDCPCFVYDFPVSQAALAKIRLEDPPVASRFEVYFKGVELANGFHELQDDHEQRLRFEADLRIRKQNNLSAVPLDENFLSALQSGLPECAGVALGLDRLMLLILNAGKIDDVLSFSFLRA